MTDRTESSSEPTPNGDTNEQPPHGDTDPQPPGIALDPEHLRAAHGRYGEYLKSAGLPIDSDELDDEPEPPVKRP